MVYVYLLGIVFVYIIIVLFKLQPASLFKDEHNILSY